MTLEGSQFLLSFEPKRDSYGFTVRPQHLQRFREYSDIYKEEEEERKQKWKRFLEQQTLSTQSEEDTNSGDSEVTEQPSEPIQELSKEAENHSAQTKNNVAEEVSGHRDHSSEQKAEGNTTKEVLASQKPKAHEVQTWAVISQDLEAIEHMMSFRVKKRKNMKVEQRDLRPNHLQKIEEARCMRKELGVDGEEEFYENKIVDESVIASAEGSTPGVKDSSAPMFPWKEELEFLVHGGIPRDLRGEVWQAFVGVRTRWVERYFQDLLVAETDENNIQEPDKLSSGDVPEKWKKQIEKDLPRTFPGHPALNENGRNSLRRVLFAYARHNPAVGYCQAMNFFAGLLLLMMPEENAFWTFVGILDDYFDGYFTHDMIESQVDQLVFEELMRERFPKLVSHLDYLGVQVAWISGPWFLSIFVNVLPWESVLRVWDVLLYEGNRVMLFRTALALMELYGPVVVTTEDAGDAITLFQSLIGSTFDSSQLVLTACVGFLNVNEDRLQGLREKHRPSVLAAVQEREKVGRVYKDPQGLATKLYSFKHKSESLKKETKTEAGSHDKLASHAELLPANTDGFLKDINVDPEIYSLPDLQEQVVWLKVELCSLLEEKRSAMLRAEELEAALMEMAKEDNRLELSARVEQLEWEVAKLQQALSDKQEQEKAMVQVLMKVEQEQKLTEDARVSAEEDAATQKNAIKILQEKYEKAMVSLAQMEKRAVMAESMLEATLQYESGQNKALASPRPGLLESPRSIPTKRTGLLSFGLGWRDRNKGKASNTEAPDENKPPPTEGSEGISTENGHQEQGKETGK